jgi:hypothetical protein
MSQFVEECQKEWSRLGVAQATANEMAADLELDLAEAEADGVSPEEVLGNGYFDARAFAGEWARARGVVSLNANARTRETPARARPLALALIAPVCLVVAGLGLVMLLGSHVGSATFAVATLRHVARPVPAILIRPGFLRPFRFGAGGAGAPIAVIGLILLVSGLVGAGISLRFLKARSTHPDPPELDRSIGMPSYF